MRVLILGAGGIGGYLGVRMIEADLDVRFLVRPERAEALRDHGLSLESSLGSWRGHPEVVVSDEIDAASDVVVLSCKAYDLDAALDAVAPAVGPQSIVVPFLNGIQHVDTIIARFGEIRVWAGVAHIGVTTGTPNRIVHLNDLNTFLIGALPNAYTPQCVSQLVEGFGRSPSSLELRSNIRQDMWDKLVFLATLAGVTCTMRTDIGTILSTINGQAIIEQLLSECSEVASAEGFPPNSEALSNYRDELMDRSSTSTASMLRDIWAGRLTEGDHILGDLVRRARRHGLDTPALTFCRTHIEAYEKHRETHGNVA